MADCSQRSAVGDPVVRSWRHRYRLTQVRAGRLSSRMVDLLVAAAVSLFGLTIWVLTGDIPPATEHDLLGSRFFPAVLSIILVACGVIHVARESVPMILKSKARNGSGRRGAHNEDHRPASTLAVAEDAGEAAEDVGETSEEPWRAAVLLGVLVAYAWMLPRVGHLLSTVALGVAFLLLMNNRRPRVLVLLPVGTAVLLHWVFSTLLLVRFP